MDYNIVRLAKFASDNGFTEAQVRAWVQKGNENGMNAAGAVVRIGRSVFIRPDRFAAWIDSQQVKPRKAA